jgi:hypothetical protein
MACANGMYYHVWEKHWQDKHYAPARQYVQASTMKDLYSHIDPSKLH